MDTSLPHQPYIAAVLAELGELVESTAVTLDYEALDLTDAMVLEAVVPLAPVVAAEVFRADVVPGMEGQVLLRWRNADGWWWGISWPDREVEEDPEELCTALVPPPSDVGRAVRALLDETAHLPLVGPETPPASSLSPPLALAVAAGDITADLAGPLAAYSV